jgi:phosphoenolpyruvate-protein kinase (PTS system EI component)
MAGDPLLVVLLLGFGFRAFSMSAGAIPMVKRGLAVLDSRVAIDLARQARRARSADEVNALLAPIADAMHGAAGVA